MGSIHEKQLQKSDNIALSKNKFCIFPLKPSLSRKEQMPYTVRYTVPAWKPSVVEAQLEKEINKSKAAETVSRYQQ